MWTVWLCWREDTAPTFVEWDEDEVSTFRSHFTPGDVHWLILYDEKEVFLAIAKNLSSSWLLIKQPE